MTTKQESFGVKKEENNWNISISLSASIDVINISELCNRLIQITIFFQKSTYSLMRTSFFIRFSQTIHLWKWSFCHWFRRERVIQYGWTAWLNSFFHLLLLFLTLFQDNPQVFEVDLWDLATMWLSWPQLGSGWFKERAYLIIIIPTEFDTSEGHFCLFFLAYLYQTDKFFYSNSQFLTQLQHLFLSTLVELTGSLQLFEVDRR